MKRQIGLLCLAISLCTQISAERSELPSPLSKEILKNFFSLLKESGYGYDSNHIETAEWIVLNSEKNLEYIKWPHSGEKNKEKWRGQLPKNRIAQAHTHSVVVNPKPSRSDRDCAARIKASVYTISQLGIWKVQLDGKITQEASKNWWVDLEK
jgi:hypothetical protein